MTLKQARETARARSLRPFATRIQPAQIAVVRATPTELCRGFYCETLNSGIPPEQIVAVYYDGTESNA